MQASNQSEWPVKIRFSVTQKRAHNVFRCGYKLYKRLCPSVGPLVRGDQVEKRKNVHFRCCCCDLLCELLSVGWVRVWRGVVRPCPPVSNDFVTTRHLFHVLPHHFLSFAMTLFALTIKGRRRLLSTTTKTAIQLANFVKTR